MPARSLAKRAAPLINGVDGRSSPRRRPNCRRSDRPTRFQTSAVHSSGVGRMDEDTPQSNFARLSKLRRRAFPFNQGRYDCLISRKTRRDGDKSVVTLLLAFASTTARARRLHSLRQSPILNEDGDIRSLRGKSDDNSVAVVPAGRINATFPFWSSTSSSYSAPLIKLSHCASNGFY
jgi:hypothetical protein